MAWFIAALLVFSIVGLNLWEYPQMITLFVLGALAEERRWTADGLSPETRRFCG